jgi:uncharacterized protein YecT (DUF1311 family)
MITRFSIALAVIMLSITALEAKNETESSPCDEYKKIDRELNRIYKKVLAEYSVNELFCKKFEESQKAWEQYRDSYIESLYPEENKAQAYGSSFEQCGCSEKSELAKDRIDQIIVWLEGAEEPGEPVDCPSSIKTFTEHKYVLTLEDFGYCWITSQALPVYSTKSRNSKVLVSAGHGDVIDVEEIDDDNPAGIWLKVRLTGEIRMGYDNGQKPKKSVTGWIFGSVKDILKCK